MNIGARFVSLVIFATVIGAGVIVSACSPKVEERGPIPKEMMPEELKDCKFFRFQTEGGTPIYVLKCDHSDVSVYKPGKSPVGTVTITEPAQDIDTQKAALDARIARLNAEMKRMELERAQLERDALK